MATQKNRDELIDGQTAEIQASASGLVDFSIGSILRAVVEAVSDVVLWLQGLILTVLRDAFATTAPGDQLDSWMAQFGFVRLPATPSNGSLTFGRSSTGSVAYIPVGTTTETADGTQSFEVIADTGNPNYDDPNDRYVMNIGVSSISVAAAAVTAGSGSNVASGTITVITSSLPGVSTVTNPSAFINGSDAESDAAFRARFIVWANSGAGEGGTDGALESAITELGVNVRVQIVENESVSGDAEPGFFYVVIDDGSGDPPDSFLEQVTAIVEAHNPLTSTFAVIPPALVTANVTLNISVASSYVGATVKALVEDAIEAYINALQLGDDLQLSRIVSVAFNASPGVTDVPLGSVMINSLNSDLSAAQKERIRPGTIVATVV